MRDDGAYLPASTSTSTINCGYTRRGIGLELLRWNSRMGGQDFAILIDNEANDTGGRSAARRGFRLADRPPPLIIHRAARRSRFHHYEWPFVSELEQKRFADAARRPAARLEWGPCPCPCPCPW